MAQPKGSAFTRRVRLACLVILVCGFGALVPLQKGIDEARSAQMRAEELLFVPSAGVLRSMCLGHEGLLADIYWTRVVQYFGRKRIDRSAQFDLLGPLLRITTELDPQLIIAYRFGAIFLAEKSPAGAGRPDEAIQLLRRGIVANPDYWRLWQDLGFIYYWDLKDYPTAARVFQAGSLQPGAQVWMKVMAASIASQGGQLSTSRLLWSQIYRQAENEHIRRSAEEHLVALQAQEDIVNLNRLLDQYRSVEGQSPRALRALVTTGLLAQIPRDPTGAPYRIAQDGRVTLSPSSKVDLRLLQ